MKRELSVAVKITIYYISVASIWFFVVNSYITKQIQQDFTPHIQNDLLFVATSSVFIYFGLTFFLKKQQRFQDELARQTTYHKHVFEQVPFVVWTTDLNLSVESAGGTGLNFLPHIASNTLQSLAQPFLDNYECYMAHQHALEGNPIDCIVRFGNHYFDVRIKPLCMEDNRIIGCIGTAVDLTDTIQMHNDLLESESRFRSLVSSMDDIIFTLDKQQRYTGVYGRWVEKSGLSPDMFPGKTPQELPGKDNALIHMLSSQRALNGEPVVYNWQNQQQGQTRYFQTRLSPIYDNRQEVKGLVGVGRDITEWKQAEQSLEEYRLQLESKVEARTQELEQEVNERIRIQKEEHKQRRIAEALRDMALILTKPLDLETILDHAINTIHALIPFDGVTIMLLKDGIVEKVRVMHHNQPVEMHITGFNPADIPYLKHMMETKTARSFDPSKMAEPSLLSKKHQWIQSAIGSPIMINNRVCGFVIIAREQSNFFTSQDIETLKFFATHIAAAIQNARLVHKMKQNAVEEERTRIANDLHDAVTQTLFSASIVAETMLSFNNDLSPSVKTGLQNLQHLTGGALAEMRTLLLELRPKKIEGMTLEMLAEQLAKAFYGRTQIPIQVMTDTLPESLDDVKLNLYRIIQEALNNIDKHARATQAYIEIRYDGDTLRLCIEDDGVGFDTTQTYSGMGLSILTERARNINAQIDICSQPQTGTKICIILHEEYII